jgi:hypothetical protein
MDEDRNGAVDRRGFVLSKEVTVGNLLTIISVLGAMTFQWFSLSQRVSTLEAENLQYHHIILDQKLIPAIEEINNTLRALRQTDDEFPPHLHLDDGEIVYPRGKEPDTHSKKR